MTATPLTDPVEIAQLMATGYILYVPPSGPMRLRWMIARECENSKPDQDISCELRDVLDAMKSGYFYLTKQGDPPIRKPNTSRRMGWREMGFVEDGQYITHLI
jgi:hypothetical protein